MKRDEIERILRERYEWHKKLFFRFDNEGKIQEAALQYNLKEEVQNIASQLLGYYL